MAVIQCPTCKRRMDVVTKTCPGCGKALVRKGSGLKRPLWIDVAAFVGLGSIFLWLIWWLVTGPSFF